jgi:two-component system response regulator HydG
MNFLNSHEANTMLETVFNTRAMEYIPQLAEPAVRLHLLVVDADAAVRSACAEIAASLGYAVESTGDLGQARSQLRGRAADILLVNLPAGSSRAWSWSPRSSCSIPTPR